MARCCVVLAATCLAAAAVNGSNAEVIGYTTDSVIRHFARIDDPDYSRAFGDLVDAGHTLTPLSTLSPEALAGIDVLVVGVVHNQEVLSSEQLDVIEQYVRGGGSLFFLSENNLFFRQNNRAFGSRFGMVFPELDGREVVAFDTPIPDHPVIDGPFGRVSFVNGTNNSLHFFGSIADPGPYARSVLNMPNGNSAVSVFEPGALNAGSGPLIVVPEYNIWENERYLAHDNRALWRNIFAYATNPVPAPPALGLLGAALLVGGRRVRRSGRTAAVCALAATTACSGGVVWDNGPLVTDPGGAFGGADLSAVPTRYGFLTLGEGHSALEGDRVADDFTLEAPVRLWGVQLYAYQTGSDLESTITEVDVRIWEGRPGEPGSRIIFGNDEKSRLLRTRWSGIYRAPDVDPFSTERPIMEQVVSLEGILLEAGTYWLDWQVSGSSELSGPWAPPVSLDEALYVGDALRFDPEDGWRDSYDPRTGVGLDFPFVLTDSPIPAPPVWAVLAIAVGIRRRRLE